MAAAGLDLLVVVDPANLNYLTRCDAWSFYTPQAVLVPGDAGTDPVWMGRAQDATSAYATCWMDPGSVVPYAESLIGTREHHPMEAVAAWIADHGYGGSRIGLETDTFCFTAHQAAVLREHLPDAGLADAYLLVNWVRARKSEAELVDRHAHLALRRGWLLALEAETGSIDPGKRADLLLFDGDPISTPGQWEQPERVALSLIDGRIVADRQGRAIS